MSQDIKKTQGDSLGYSFNQDDGLQQMNPRPQKDRTYVDDDRKISVQKLGVVKVGDKINYGKETGVIVQKSGLYLTIFNELKNKYDTIHVSETFYQTDVVNGTTWDKMPYEARVKALMTNGIPKEPYITRPWFDLPKNVRDLLHKTASNAYTEPQRGGFAGREPGITRDDEGRSFRESDPKNDKPVNEKSHVDTQKSEMVPKSDVEHGWYGGINTDTEPLDATDDYEEDDRVGNRKQIKYQDRDATDKRDGINYSDTRGSSGEITFPPIKNELSPKKKEDLKKEGDAGAVTTSTPGTNNPIFGKPEEKKKHYGSRYGVRYSVSQDEFNTTKT